MFDSKNNTPFPQVKEYELKRNRKYLMIKGNQGAIYFDMTNYPEEKKEILKIKNRLQKSIDNWLKIIDEIDFQINQRTRIPWKVVARAGDICSKIKEIVDQLQEDYPTFYNALNQVSTYSLEEYLEEMATVIQCISRQDLLGLSELHYPFSDFEINIIRKRL
jgi:hypothetical protein